MNQINTSQISDLHETNEEIIVRGPRYERNRKYYLKNIKASQRSTLLHGVKWSGRIPMVKTINYYDIKPEELILNWRHYAQLVQSKNVGIPPLKLAKFRVLIANMV